MKWILGILSSALMMVNSLAFATDLEIAESVWALAANESESGVKYTQKCNEWKSAVKNQLGPKALYVSCGAKEIGAVETQSSREVWTEYYDANGNRVGEYVTHYTPAGKYGYVTVSDSKLLLSVEGEVKLLKEEIHGDPNHCKVAQLSPCLTARLAARTSFELECSHFKESAQASFGSRLVYASCGTATNKKSSSLGTEFLYGSKGTIFYQ